MGIASRATLLVLAALVLCSGLASAARTKRGRHGGGIVAPAVVEGPFLVAEFVEAPAGFGVAEEIEGFHGGEASGVWLTTGIRKKLCVLVMRSDGPK